MNIDKVVDIKVESREFGVLGFLVLFLFLIGNIG